MDEKVKNLNNNYSYNRKILKNKLENSINIILNNNNINKNLIINKINSEYNNKLKELNNEYDNKLKEIKKEQEEKNKKELEKKKQYNLENYDLLYDSKFDELEIENIFKDLIEKNISHIKKWNKEENYIHLPEDSALIEINNKNISVIEIKLFKNENYNYETRMKPFLEYLKTIDLLDINLKLIVIFFDMILGFDKKYINDIPILCSSISNTERNNYNNLVLIPNMYFYNKDRIPINEVKMNDINFDNKIKKMDFSGSSTNKLRLEFAKWASNKKINTISCNLLNFY